MWAKKQQGGFMIVELLIVIVVIGILAALSIVSYSGIQQRARASEASAALNQARKKLELYRIDNSSYPLTGNLAASGLVDGDVSYQYTSDGTTYCITGTAATVSYKATDAITPVAGACPGHTTGGVVMITNLVMNPSLEVDLTGWGNAAGGVATRSTSDSKYGSASVLVTVPANAISGSGTNLRASGISGIQAGNTYTSTVWFRGAAGILLFINLDEYSGGTYISQVGTTITTDGTWQRVQLTKTISTGNSLQMGVRVNLANAAQRTFYVDGAMITQGTTPYNYGDGTSTDWSWNGTPHNSTSVGPAL